MQAGVSSSEDEDEESYPSYAEPGAGSDEEDMMSDGAAALEDYAQQKEATATEDDIKDIYSLIEGFQTPAANVDITKAQVEKPKTLYDVLPEVSGGQQEGQLFGSKHTYAMPQAEEESESKIIDTTEKAMEPPAPAKGNKDKTKKDKKYKVKF